MGIAALKGSLQVDGEQDFLKARHQAMGEVAGEIAKEGQGD